MDVQTVGVGLIVLVAAGAMIWWVVRTLKGQAPCCERTQQGNACAGCVSAERCVDKEGIPPSV